MEFWIGTSGFQYPEWRGTFYPQNMPATRMLSFYAQHFGSTEINYSFRRIPSPKTIDNWNNTTPPEFRFTFKAPQKVTHFARLKDSADTMEYFYSVVSRLGPKLGTVLFQLPPDFEKDLSRLRFFLDTIPSKLRAAFEFRHPSWFDDDVFAVLHDHNAALCIAESEKLTTPRHATADFGYVRLRRADYSNDQLDDWAEYIHSQQWRWREAYVYFKHEESGVGPKFAQRMKEALQMELSHR